MQDIATRGLSNEQMAKKRMADVISNSTLRHSLTGTSGLILPILHASYAVRSSCVPTYYVKCNCRASNLQK